MKIVLFLILQVCLSQVKVLDVDNEYLVEIKEDEQFEEDLGRIEQMNGNLYMSVKKYYCTVEHNSNSDLILYSTKAWTFPNQDVSLDLEYPSNNLYDVEESVDFILTGLQVILRHTGTESNGFITSGGMLQDHISMTFVFRNITSLAYDFYLYGIPKNRKNNTENYTAIINLC